MKKLFSLILILSLILTFAACASDQTNQTTPPQTTSPPTTQPTETTSITEDKGPAVKIDGDVITMGSFKMSIPDGFSVTSSDDNTFLISSDDGVCVIGAFAADVSLLTEEQIINNLPKVHSNFMTKNATRVSETETEYAFGPFKLTLDLYAEITDDLAPTINMDTSFTDSWYAYTVLFRSYADADEEINNRYFTEFAKFCAYAEYTGADARFDFIQ